MHVLRNLPSMLSKVVTEKVKMSIFYEVDRSRSSGRSKLKLLEIHQLLVLYHMNSYSDQEFGKVGMEGKVNP